MNHRLLSRQGWVSRPLFFLILESIDVFEAWTQPRSIEAFFNELLCPLFSFVLLLIKPWDDDSQKKQTIGFSFLLISFLSSKSL